MKNLMKKKMLLFQKINKTLEVKGKISLKYQSLIYSKYISIYNIDLSQKKSSRQE